MGIFSYSRALRVAVTTWGVLSFGPAPDLAAGTLLSPGPGQEICRAIRGVCISPNRRRTAGEMPGYPAQARRGAGATGALRRDLRIVIMRDTIRGEDHAVAAARLDGHWLTLDNRRMAMVEDAYVRNYGRCLLSINTASCSMSTHPCSRPPRTARAPQRSKWLSSPA